MRKMIQGAFAGCLLTTISALGAAQQAAQASDMQAAALAADPKVAGFYRGNTVYMMIGSATGGGFDFYGRTVGKYMAKYIPGNPTVVPQNLPGAGGYTAASRIALTAPQDGTYIGGIHPTVIVDPILGDPAKGAKQLKFAYLGNAAENVEACFLRTDAPAKSFEDGFKTQMVLGASNGASSTREYASLLKNILGMNIKIVTGYTGNAEIFLAIDRGEVEGICGASYLNVIATKPQWFKDGFVKAISHQGSKTLPDMKEMSGVKPALAFAKTDEQRQILSLYDRQGEFGRPYVTGGDVPPDRVKALRAAFMSAINDPDLRKEVEARGLEVSPASGEIIQKLANEMYDTPPEILKKTRVALGYE